MSNLFAATQKLTIMIVVVCISGAFFLCSAVTAREKNSELTSTLEVGSAEEAALLRGLYEKYPESRSEIDRYRKETAKLAYGTKVEFKFNVADGSATINWKEVAAGAVAGLTLAILWQWFGGEAFCAIGFVPACACVGPQC